MSKGQRTILTTVLFIASVIVGEAIVKLFEIDPLIFPAPSMVAKTMIDLFKMPNFLTHVGITLTETLLGFAIGAVAGLFLGTIVALNKYVDMLLYPYIVAFQSLPKVALAPLMVIWFGFDMTPKVINAALIAFFPLLVNCVVGLKSADEDRVNLLRSLSASESQIFFKLRLPGAMPFIFAGVDVAIVFALIGAIVGELQGATKGLGYLLDTFKAQLNVPGTFAILVILSVIGLVLNLIVKFLRKRLLFWDASEKSSHDQQFVA